MQVLHDVRRFIREHDLAQASTRVVAAVSGGSDSVALLHLLHGLGARHPRGATLVRPLVAGGRRDLRGVLAGRGVSFVEDESNGDVAIPRNRVRLELLPFLERINPAVTEVLADEASIAQEVWAW